jgi:hypothetical protein
MFVDCAVQHETGRIAVLGKLRCCFAVSESEKVMNWSAIQSTGDCYTAAG